MRPVLFTRYLLTYCHSESSLVGLNLGLMKLFLYSTDPIRNINSK